MLTKCEKAPFFFNQTNIKQIFYFDRMILNFSPFFYFETDLNPFILVDFFLKVHAYCVWDTVNLSKFIFFHEIIGRNVSQNGCLKIWPKIPQIYLLNLLPKPISCWFQWKKASLGVTSINWEILSIFCGRVNIYELHQILMFTEMEMQNQDC